MSELRFLSPFDEGDTGGKPVADHNYIELHPLGRVENCYRWAGESDVFEAIEDVCRCYNIDRNRIVLRGMSMGASGTWHLGLREHYQRAELDATAAEEGTITIKEPKNITRFAILSPMLQSPTARLIVGGQVVSLPRCKPVKTPRGVVMERGGTLLEQQGGKWVAKEYREKMRLTGKRPGLQGPIDDAFTTPFLCVRGTGKPWNPEVQAWTEASLRRFAYEWNRYFRGELPVKDDTAVTPEDCRRYNLILFGDPGSNVWIRKALTSLPLRWTKETWQIGADRYASANHAPALICPSPFTAKDAPARYLVINSGHTFHEAELNRLNYLLFPRLGDWAVFKVGDSQPQNPSDPLQEEVIQAGFWNEQWRPAAKTGQRNEVP
jgi:hypothetical protein